VLENLEDRALLSAIVVNTIKDSTDALTSPIISLRDAISRANASKAPVSITFDPKVFATLQTIILSGSPLVLNNTVTPITITGPADSVDIYGTNGIQTVGDFVIASKTTATLTGLIISGGHATYGAGVDNAGTVTLNQDLLDGDDAPNGGGIFNSGVATLIDSTISYCDGTTGGGIWNMGGGKLTLTNVTLSDNSAAVGGGIYNGGGGVSGGTTELYSSTIFGNNSGNGSGAGVFNASGATVGLVNTLIGGNLTVPVNRGPTYGPDVTGAFSSKGHNLIEATDSSSGWVSTDLTGTETNRLNPLTTDLAYNGGPTPTIVPLDGSPLIGHGSVAQATAITTDQRGLPRFVNGAIDIGAVESASLVVNTTSDLPDPLDNQNDNVPTGPSPFGTLALREAIAIANLEPDNPTSITFNATVFATKQTITTNGTVMAIANTHGQGRVSPLTITAPAAGLIINGGLGIYVGGKSIATLIGLTFTNVAGSDGVVTNYLGNVTLVNDTFTGNHAADGAVDNLGVAVLKGDTITGNKGTVEGGVVNYRNGHLTMTNTTISNNSGKFYAGGLLNDGVATLSGDTISGNTGAIGGGIDNTSGATLSVTNSTIANNSAPSGGGINNAGTVQLYSTTITGNSASSSGGGVYNATNATVSLVNTIIAKNALSATTATGPDVFGTFASGGFNLIGETNGSKGWLSTDLTGTLAKPLDPKLGALGFNGGPTQTIVPQAGSPALKHGSVALASGILTDQRGLPRVVNGSIDIGSVEVQ
jgi:hypothetical protein